MTSAIRTDPGSHPTFGADDASAEPRAPGPYLAAVPDSGPAFDDEAGPAERLRAVARVRGWSGTRPGPAVRLTRPAPVTDAQVPSWSRDADVGIRRTASASLPAAEQAGATLARALVEVLGGRRPLAQLRIHCAPDVFAGLQARFAVATASVRSKPSTPSGPAVPTGPAGPVTPTRPTRPAPGTSGTSGPFRPASRFKPHEPATTAMTSVRVSQPADGVAEVAAVYRATGRAHAVAFRLQGIDGRWRMTHLQCG